MSIEMKALTLAYKCVTELGWSHSRLMREYGITLPTLRRVREGRRGKDVTDEYCMKVFVTILHQAFQDNLTGEGGSRSQFFNNDFREILLALFRE